MSANVMYGHVGNLKRQFRACCGRFQTDRPVTPFSQTCRATAASNSSPASCRRILIGGKALLELEDTISMPLGNNAAMEFATFAKMARTRWTICHRSGENSVAR